MSFDWRVEIKATKSLSCDEEERNIKMIKSRVICDMELPYLTHENERNSCFGKIEHVHYGLIFGKRGFRCYRYEWECSRVFPSGEIRIGG